MASLLSRYAPGMRRGKQRFEEFDAAERARDAALAESGRDPFAERLQSMIPVNQATDVAREEGAAAGIASWAGGGPGQGAMSVVANPTHQVAQFLSKYYPKVSGALERNPFRFEFKDLPAANRNLGYVDPPAGSLRGREQEKVSLPALRQIQAGPTGKNIDILIDPKLAGDEANITTLHEVLHALYGTKPYPAHLGGEEEAYSSFGPSAKHAAEIIFGNTRPLLQGGDPAMQPKGRFSRGTASRSGLEGDELERQVTHYENRGGEEHMAVETIARALYADALRRGQLEGQARRPLQGEPDAGILTGLRRRLFGK